MTVDPLQSAFQLLRQAQEARQRGDVRAARHFAEQALQLAPHAEEPWLMMAALAAPRASVEYLQKALQINPHSERAKQGMVWAVKRLEKEEAHLNATKPQPTPQKTQPTQPLHKPAAPKPEFTRTPAPAKRRSPLFPVVLITITCAVLVYAAWVGGVTPALALLETPTATPEHGEVWSEVDIAKPSYTPTFTPTFTPTNTPTDTPTPTPTNTPTDTPTPTFTPTDTPTITPTYTPSNTPLPSNTPQATFTPRPTQKPAAAASGKRWIEVNLTQQMLYAWEGDVLINSFVISSGTWLTPTVTGTYYIWHKTPIQDMSGPGYYLPDVQWVMYFYKDYGIHGTYWHNNFGTPMSHGCVNMRNADAEWLYYFASYGTMVYVHY